MGTDSLWEPASSGDSRELLRVSEPGVAAS